MLSRLRRNYERTDELNRQVILELAVPAAGATLIDLGCGDGAFTQRLRDRIGATRAIGVELIPDLADAAERRGVEVVRADLGQPLPLDDASADVVHSNQVVEHLTGTDQFMSEIRRVLRPGGYAIVSTNNLASVHNIVSLLLGYQPMPSHVSDEVVGLGNPLNPYTGIPGSKGQMHLRLFTGRGLGDLARYHGLEVEVARTAGFYPFGPDAARLATRLLPRHGAFLVQRYRIAS